MQTQKNKPPLKAVLKNLRVLLIFACLFTTLASVLIVRPTQAVTSSTINFQARLMTAAGSIVPDGNYHVEFKMYTALTSSGSSQGSCSGDSSCVWVETRTTGNLVRAANGYLTVNLGSVNPFGATINWDQNLWLGMNIGGNGGSASWDGEMSPRLQLTATPYAFRAGQLSKFNNSTGFTSTLSLVQPTVGNQTFQIADQGAAGTYTLCIQNSAACGFAASSGSGNYIQNGIAQQTANFNIVSSSAGSVGALIQGATSATQPVAIIKGGVTPSAGGDLLQLQNSSGGVLARFDSSGNLGIGSTAPSRPLTVTTNDSQTTLPMAMLEQKGTGDTTLEFKSPVNSFIVGQDSSDSSKFKISSSAASGISAAAVGSTTIGTNTDSGNRNVMSGSKFSTGVTAGLVSSISVYLKNADTTPNNLFQVAIYDATGLGGNPGNLVASSASATAVSNAWNTVAISGTLSPSTNYWLMYNTNGSTINNNNTVYDPGAGINGFRAQTFGTWPSSFGAAQTGTARYSIYASFAVVGAYDSFDKSLFALTDTGQATYQNSTNSTTAFQIQNAAGNNVLSVDTSSNAINLGKASGLTGQLDFYNSGGANAVGLQAASGSAAYVLTLPGTAPATGQCLQAGAVTAINLTFATCGANTSLSNLSSVAINTSLLPGGTNSIDVGAATFSFRSGYFATSIQAPLLDTTGILSLGTSSTGINLNQNTTIASGKTLTVTSGATSLTGATTGDALTVSNNTSTGNVAMFKDNTTAVATIADGGAVALQNSVNATNAFQVQNASGSALVNVDTTANVVGFTSGSGGSVGPWHATSSLPPGTGINGGAAVTANGFAYYIGGSGALSTVYYSQLSTNGSAGAWQSTTVLPVGLTSPAAVVSGGYIYVIGGSLSAANTVSNDVYSAPINGNGTLGSWTKQTTTPVSAGRSFMGVATANGFLYLMGGFDPVSSTPQSNVYVAKFAASGTLDSSFGTSGWLTSTSLPVAIDSGHATTANNYLYFFGGEDASSSRNSVYSATINPSTGVVGNWTALPQTLPVPLDSGAIAVVNSTVYIIGGENRATNAQGLAGTYTAQLGPAGSLSGWTSSSFLLPSSIWNTSAVVYANNIYLMGGKYRSVSFSTVYVAYAGGAQLVVSDGSSASVSLTGATLSSGNLTPWRNSPNLIPVAADGGRSVTNNGFIYYLGGLTQSTPSSISSANVYYAHLNADGSVGGWMQTAALPAARAFGDAVVANGYIYYVAGLATGGTLTSTVYAAFINNDGSLGAWSTLANSFGGGTPVSTAYLHVILANGYLYGFAGQVGASPSLDVYSAQVTAGGTTGVWTKQVAAPMPAGALFSSTVLYNGYIYVMGGSTSTSSSNATTTVYSAQIASGGTLNSSFGTSGWLTLSSTPLPTTSGAACSVVSNGFIYQIAGYIAGGVSQSQVFASQIASNGTLNTWATLSNITPASSNFLGCAASDSYVYALGGFNGLFLNNIAYASTQGNVKVSGSLALNGSAAFQSGTNSSSAFQVQDASSNPIFNIDTTNALLSITGSMLLTATSAMALQAQSTTGLDVLTVDTSSNNLQVGSSTTDATAVLLTLDSYNTGTDPTGTNGAMYYNSSLGKFRCFENGVWYSCLNGLNDAVTVQDNQGGTVVTTTSSTFVSLGTQCGTAFVAPPSGKVMISYSTEMKSSTIAVQTALSIAVRTGSTVGSGTTFLAAAMDDYVAQNQNSQYARVGGQRMVSGLTPGSTYNVRLEYASNGTATLSANHRSVTVGPIW